MVDYIITEKHLQSLLTSVGDENKSSETGVNNKKHLNESIGWADAIQGFADVVGIFDPTGLVDLTNGVVYVIRGNYLFGFLSIVSAVPYIGDAAAKPVMASLKLGKPSAKALEKVLELSKAGKQLEAAAELNKLTEMGGVTGTFIKKMRQITPKLKGGIDRFPSTMFGGLKKTLKQWIELFEGAAKRNVAIRVRGANLAKKFKKYNRIEQVDRLNQLIKLSKETKGVFTGYRTNKGFFSWKNVFGGLPQLMGRNKSVRSLMRQTKWWLGFLDYFGYGNFIGPDEVAKKLGSDEEMIDQMAEYNKTQTARQYFQEDFGDAMYDPSLPPPPSYNFSSNEPEVDIGDDDEPFGAFLNALTAR